MVKKLLENVSNDKYVVKYLYPAVLSLAKGKVGVDRIFLKIERAKKYYQRKLYGTGKTILVSEIFSAIVG